MNNININIEYNYLIDDQICMFPDNYCIDKRRDPDSDSKRLYDDILTIFFSENNSAKNLEQQFYGKPKFYTIKINNDTLLSSDYIGPSVYWARERGVSDDKIRDFLKQCRTIGGHIVWERGSDLKYKVNTSRSGSDGVYDRFDWTLLLLKIFLSDVKQDVNSFVGKANKYIPEKYRDTKNTNTKLKIFILLLIALNGLKFAHLMSFANALNCMEVLLTSKTMSSKQLLYSLFYQLITSNILIMCVKL